MKKENIIFSIINTEHYAYFLPYVPCRQFEDLSVVYYEHDKENSLYRLIGNLDMAYNKMTEEELYELAKENTRRIMPPVVQSMSQAIIELSEENNEELDIKTREELEKTEELMYLITNEQRIRGATSILYSDVMEEVSEKLGGDIYLIPSSVNEIIAVSKNNVPSVEELQEQVHFTNLLRVELGERLSNQVYEYDATTKLIRQATFSPYTKLNEGRPMWSKNVIIDKDEVAESEQNDVGMQMGM